MKSVRHDSSRQSVARTSPLTKRHKKNEIHHGLHFFCHFFNVRENEPKSFTNLKPIV